MAALESMVRDMTDGREFRDRITRTLQIALATFALQAWSVAGPAPAANSGFNLYVETIERRLRPQHEESREFLAATSSETATRLRRGELIVEQLTPKDSRPPGAMLHHWRGSAFVAGASAKDFERFMREFTAYPQYYRPQVVSAKVLSHDGDHYRAMLRLRQHHVITVVMDTTYEISFGRLDARQGYSASRSTRVAEVAEAGSGGERELKANEEHGFLWRLNTYWSYVEADGGLYMQIESVSLTRDIPRGLGWIAGPFVQSIPRESLEFTLSATRDALRTHAGEREEKQQ